jgi:tetratricopeptide (TPR) repeat protein
LEETGKPDFRILSAKVEQRKKTYLRRKLWEKFDIDFIERHHMRRMVELLAQVEKGGRLTDKDVLWLTTNNYFTHALRRAYHKIEALHFCDNFKKSKDPWQAVNASSHYRKADQSLEALRLLDQVNIDGQSDKHLKAALCTTKGGSNRDLKQFDEALQLAEKAHSYEPGSFHPCTLLGAVNYELGNHLLGNEWFAKAIERGANPEAIDHELRSIFTRADKAHKENLKQHLLKIDPVRYSWVNKSTSPQKGKDKTKLSRSSNRPR